MNQQIKELGEFDEKFYDQKREMKDKEYKIDFTADYTQYEEWVKEGDLFWKEKIESNPEKLAICKKYKGKTIRLSDIPALVEEVGDIILSEDVVEIYNDYRE